MPAQRSRWLYLGALIATIVLGLATRDSSIGWPEVVAVHAGDALWAVAVYLTIACVFHRAPAVSVVVAALLISYCVELSQLLDWSFLKALRETVAGQLLLGTGFQWFDFPRYTAGALFAFTVDRVYLASLAKP